MCATSSAHLPSLQEESHCTERSHVSTLLRQHQWRHPSSIDSLRITPGLEERFNTDAVAGGSHQMERGSQLGVHSERVGTGVEKHPDHVRVPLRRRRMERRHTTEWEKTDSMRCRKTGGGRGVSHMWNVGWVGRGREG